MIHKNIKVTGRVQGVFFRGSTKDKADELGIVGWCRNESDGSVYIEAEAEPNVMSEFMQWVQRGPTFSKVKEVIEDDGPLENFTSFSVRY